MRSSSAAAIDPSNPQLGSQTTCARLLHACRVPEDVHTWGGCFDTEYEVAQHLEPPAHDLQILASGSAAGGKAPEKLLIWARVAIHAGRPATHPQLLFCDAPADADRSMWLPSMHQHHYSEHRL